MNDYTTVILHRDTNERVATITLNRPDKRNAINDKMVEELRGALTSLLDDRQITVVVLAGAGEAFCAGADLSVIQAMQNSDYHENLSNSRALRDLMYLLYTFPKPTIAAVKGPALAGGCGLATACDFVIADEDASFGYPEVKIGFVAAIVMVLLTRQIGERAARELLLTGRRLSAQDAYEFGLINQVVEVGELDAAVAKQVAELINNSPQAMAVSKELLVKSWSGGLEQLFDDAAALNARVRGMDDCLEGISAFLEKRRPIWTGDVTVVTGKA